MLQTLTGQPYSCSLRGTLAVVRPAFPARLRSVDRGSLRKVQAVRVFRSVGVAKQDKAVHTLSAAVRRPAIQASLQQIQARISSSGL